MQCGREGALASAVSLHDMSTGKSCSQVGSSRVMLTSGFLKGHAHKWVPHGSEQVVQSKAFSLFLSHAHTESK
eukprot:4492587-Pleurochrysis_carterae.AAC.1